MSDDTMGKGFSATIGVIAALVLVGTILPMIVCGGCLKVPQ
jgi:hypothetical protein